MLKGFFTAEARSFAEFSQRFSAVSPRLGGKNITF